MYKFNLCIFEILSFFPFWMIWAFSYLSLFFSSLLYLYQWIDRSIDRWMDWLFLDFFFYFFYIYKVSWTYSLMSDMNFWKLDQYILKSCLYPTFSNLCLGPHLPAWTLRLLYMSIMESPLSLIPIPFQFCALNPSTFYWYPFHIANPLF